MAMDLDARFDTSDPSPDAGGDGLLDGGQQGDVTTEDLQIDADADAHTPLHYPLDDVLRLQHIQAKGTHNSYHRRPDRVLFGEHDYEHPTLTDQLSLHGVRAFELDIHNGGDEGYLVYHIPVLDDKTTCRIFKDCLRELKAWSDENPLHHPIFVWIEPKDDIDLTNPIEDYDALDAEILEIWPQDRLITPASVKGGHENLHSAITTVGWPTLGRSRGKAIFMLLDTGKHRDGYVNGQFEAGALDDRVLFVDVKEDELTHPLASVIKINNPASETIADAIANGLLVGSNIGAADGSDEENRGKLESGVESGVHMMTGDFPAPVADRDYWFDMPDGQPSRCNEATAPPECTATDIEHLP
jgi:hypothetical protein